jgi:hypothetical protein
VLTPTALAGIGAGVTRAVCARAFFLGFGLGLGAAAVVVVEVVVAAALVVTLCVELDDEDAEPHALSATVSRTAAAGILRCLIALPSGSPVGGSYEHGRHGARVGSRSPPQVGQAGSEQEVNAPASSSIASRFAATIVECRITSAARCSSSTTSRRSPRWWRAT